MKLNAVENVTNVCRLKSCKFCIKGEIILNSGLTSQFKMVLCAPYTHVAFIRFYCWLLFKCSLLFISCCN